MSQRLEAVYEKGVFRPLQPVNLRENQRITLTLGDGGNGSPEGEWLDVEYLRACAPEADDSISLEAVRQALAKIPGSLTADFLAEREER
jgi:predicted DNA-binding antitoxin AbrB/MazE fold protein